MGPHTGEDLNEVPWAFHCSRDMESGRGVPQWQAACWCLGNGPGGPRPTLEPHVRGLKEIGSHWGFRNSPGLQASWRGAGDAAGPAGRIRGDSSLSAGEGGEREGSQGPAFPSTFLAPSPQTLLPRHLVPEICLGPSGTCFILFPSLRKAGPLAFSILRSSDDPVLVDEGRSQPLPPWPRSCSLLPCSGTQTP